MNTKELLIAARALIDVPEKWQSGWLNGELIGHADTGGAILSACRKEGLHAVDLVCGAMDAAVPPEFTIRKSSGMRPYVQYMDRENATHADAMALFDRAIAAQDVTA